MRLIGLAVVLTFSLILAPAAAEAQRAGKIAHVGVLDWGPTPSREEVAKFAISREMRDLGWVDGQNMVIELRFAQSTDQLRAGAAELVQLKVDVIIVPGSGIAAAARRETNTIPIVIVGAGYDLVSAGLVASLARPGGNITGSQVLDSDLFGKKLQLLKECCVPNLSRVASLRSFVSLPDLSPFEERRRGDLADLARPLGIEVHIFNVVRPEDFPALFLKMVKQGDHGLIVQLSPFMGVHRRQIIDLAARHRIAAMYGSRGSVQAGGLISYGANYADLARRTASFVDKVLKGAKPADLPIEQPTKFDLAINLKTAKTLGLTIPPTVLLQADQVIE